MSSQVSICVAVNQMCPNLKLLLFDSQCAKRPVITKLSLSIHVKVQSSTECPCLTSTGLHLYRFSLSRDTKDDDAWEGRDKPLSLTDIAKPNYGKGFKPKFFIEHGSWGDYETVDEINKNIRSQEIQPTLLKI